MSSPAVADELASTQAPIPKFVPGTCVVRTPQNAVDRFIVSLLRDERDLYVVHTILKASLAIPMAACFFLIGGWAWLLLPVYVWFVATHADRVGLTIHVIIHKPLFKKGYWLLEQWLPAFLCTFYGHTPYTFYIHHIGMHHADGNMPRDRSSTMKYERDNWWHFCLYWWRFFFIGMIDMTTYFIETERPKLLRFLWSVELTYYAIVGVLLYFFPMPTFVVFVAPYLVMRYAMMAGNWSQHAFVDPEQPGNDYRLSVTLLDARHNRRNYNDGYHVVHHIKPALHWSEMPGEFERNRHLYAENKSIVFKGIMGYQHLWGLLMKRDYESLADHFVDCGEEKMSREEVIALLKSRTRPIPV